MHASQGEGQLHSATRRPCHPVSITGRRRAWWRSVEARALSKQLRAGAPLSVSLLRWRKRHADQGPPNCETRDSALARELRLSRSAELRDSYMPFYIDFDCHTRGVCILDCSLYRLVLSATRADAERLDSTVLPFSRHYLPVYLHLSPAQRTYGKMPGLQVQVRSSMACAYDSNK